MANIGPIIKSIRTAEEITLGRLYRGILSNRQAIRFEHGESDIKAEGLFNILNRLDMSVSEFTYRYDTIIDNTEDHQRPVNQAIDRLDTWMDTDINSNEQRAVEQYVRDQPIVTLQQAKKVISLLPALQDQQVDTVISHVLRTLLNHWDQHSAKESLRSLWGDMTYHWLLNGQRDRAVMALKKWQTISETLPHSFTVTVQIHFVEVLLTSLSLSPKAIYEQTDPLIASARVLGDDDWADAFVDNRRHALTAFHKHPQWQSAEVGAIARFMTKLETNSDMPEYLNQIPGLIDFLANQNKSLSDYLSSY
ncbi:MAG: hypothetical protein LKI92_08975 [Schleiferilactobacillus harbinensis]|jgi:transcriptional regulator with XRE-family HTH domain|nr:hypothetical protein [Schleiferilactobacillus harbinensis]MCI1914085.1 hypothetical protein [Schleiferilactobacillus harbinensis]